MLLEDLIRQFIQVKNHAPLHANELLDYTQKNYIQGKLSIVEYKSLFRELNQRGAEKPEFFICEDTPETNKKAL